MKPNIPIQKINFWTITNITLYLLCFLLGTCMAAVRYGNGN